MESILSLGTFCLLCILCVRDVWSQRYNTYVTETTRATPFVPRVLVKTCLLTPDPGPCRGNLRMYYFDPLTMDCSRFQWGGCMGNGNRFETEELCMDHCKSKIGFLRPRPKWCALRFDYGFCFGALERWYYDVTWKVCKKVIYSGCGGNKNNFYNLAQCEEICRFGHISITSSTKTDTGLKRVIVINPYNSTPARSRNQSLITEDDILGIQCSNVTRAPNGKGNPVSVPTVVNAKPT